MMRAVPAPLLAPVLAPVLALLLAAWLALPGHAGQLGGLPDPDIELTLALYADGGDAPDLQAERWLRISGNRITTRTTRPDGTTTTTPARALLPEEAALLDAALTEQTGLMRPGGGWMRPRGDFLYMRWTLADPSRDMRAEMALPPGQIPPAMAALLEQVFGPDEALP